MLSRDILATLLYPPPTVDGSETVWPDDQIY